MEAKCRCVGTSLRCVGTCCRCVGTCSPQNDTVSWAALLGHCSSTSLVFECGYTSKCLRCACSLSTGRFMPGQSHTLPISFIGRSDVFATGASRRHLKILSVGLLPSRTKICLTLPTCFHQMQTTANLSMPSTFCADTSGALDSHCTMSRST